MGSVVEQDDRRSDRGPRRTVGAHSRDATQIDAMLDPLDPPPRPAPTFKQRLKWWLDPHRCIGKRHNGDICRNRVWVHGERCWDCWVDLVRFGTQNQKILMAGLPDLPAPVLQRLATDESPAVRSIVAEHAPSLTVDLQVFLAGDVDNPITYRTVAERHDLCEEAAQMLVRHGDALTFGALITNPVTPRSVIASITDNPNPEIAQAAAQRLANMPDLDDLDGLGDLLDGTVDQDPGTDADPDADEEPETDPEPDLVGDPVVVDGPDAGTGPETETGDDPSASGSEPDREPVDPPDRDPGLSDPTPDIPKGPAGQDATLDDSQDAEPLLTGADDES